MAAKKVPTTTQELNPWKSTARTIFQALVAFAAMWGIIVEALGFDAGWQWVAISLAVTGGITRLMALPQVEGFLERFFPWLAAENINNGGARKKVGNEPTV